MAISPLLCLSVRRIFSARNGLGCTFRYSLGVSQRKNVHDAKNTSGVIGSADEQTGVAQ